MHSSLWTQETRHLYRRPVNTGNKNTPSAHPPRRLNVTTSIVGSKYGHIRERLAKNGEPQTNTWERRRRRRRSTLWCIPVCGVLNAISLLPCATQFDARVRGPFCYCTSQTRWRSGPDEFSQVSPQAWFWVPFPDYHN